ncbi:hypothetical protein BCR42DRAFT_400999 [Absidia repens]|uniref:Uncharacterized protein n=1 Tax=Absidia repens TaxID=90262 RepID=A0A1X2J3L2_9FUNG|nr:hypothetical protein BCR42DRAFT_400999 [Absidia repens]
MTDSSLDMSSASLISSSQQLDDSQYTEDSGSSILSSLPSIPSLPPIDVDTRVLQQDIQSTSTSSPRSSLSSYNRDNNTRQGSSSVASLPSPRQVSANDDTSSPSDKTGDTNKQRPPLRQLIWGHARSFSFMLGRFMFKDNNLPLILNIMGHLLAARQLWGKSKSSVARYTNIQQQQGSLSGTAALVADQFKSIGVLHLSLGLLAGLALKERRLSTERTALWVLSVAAWSQSFVQGKAYLQSPTMYTLKALQEWGALNGILTVITTIALRNTMRRTGRII